MSRRFGRNQRRRAREEQARLSADLGRTNEALSMSTALATDRGQRLQELTAELQRAKDLLPANSVLMRPQAVPVDGEPRHRIELDATDHGDMSFLQLVEAPTVTFQSVPLDVLLTEVKREELAPMLHCRVKFAGADLCYAISEKAMDAMPRKYLAEQLTRELTRQFTPALAKALGKHR